MIYVTSGCPCFAPFARIWAWAHNFRPWFKIKGAILGRCLRKSTRPVCAPIASTHAWSARTAIRFFISASSRSLIRDLKSIRGCPCFPARDTSRGSQVVSSLACRIRLVALVEHQSVRQARIGRTARPARDSRSRGNSSAGNCFIPHAQTAGAQEVAFSFLARVGMRSTRQPTPQ